MFSSITSVTLKLIFLYNVKKYQHTDLVKHIIDNHRNTLYITRLFAKIKEGKYFVFDQEKKGNIILYGYITKFTKENTDPNVVKLEDPLVLSQSNVEIFKLLLPIIIPHYTTEQKFALIEDLICTKEPYGIVGLNELKNNNGYFEYDRTYFALSKRHSQSEELTKFFAECFQKK